MKTPRLCQLFLFIGLLVAAPTVYPQASSDAPREKTRERLSALLTRIGPDLKVSFQPSSKSPYNFIGMMKEGLTNCESLEIVLFVTDDQQIRIRVFPHYNGGYVNIDKARNTTQLLRKIAQLNEGTFLFWGADETGDVFTGYTFTLESGFPDEALRIVLASVKNSDKFVGQMRPSIDGSNAP
jgi:hypothetical protein